MSLCLSVAGKTITLAVSAFSLSWQHSVEKVAWQEDWQVTTAGLHLETARVKGSGAGMEPGDGAVLTAGWWQWQPQLPVQPELRLAASGATGSGWIFCSALGCMELGKQADTALVLSSCQ